jgi:hypothetical protein
MKVIGAGLPRTATTTHMIALEKLGFGRVYHMRDVLMNMQDQLPLWEAAADGNPDWQTIFGDANSSCDAPSACFYRELMEVYPDAKVMLTVRSPEGWVKSMRETVWGVYFGDSVNHYVNAARQLVDPLWDRYIKLMTRLLWAEGGDLHGDTFDDAEFGKLMERYNQSVIDYVPADRLLVWDPKQGWEPMCEFLGVAVPDEPLPHVNDTNSFKEGVVGGAINIINKWWDEREKPTSGLHGAAL